MLQIVYLISFFICTFPQCINYEPQTNLCDFCSYDDYPNNDQIINLISSLKAKISPENCLEKINFTLNRKILIIDPSLTKTNDLYKNFDGIYDDLLRALISENNFSQKYIRSNLDFYFSQGAHYLVRPDLESNSYFYTFFRRLSSGIIMKPLRCEDFNDSNICFNNGQKANLFMKSLIFSFYVSKSMVIQDIIIDFIESVFPYEEDRPNICLLSKEIRCCNESSLKNENINNSCYLFTKSITNDKINLKLALFIIEGIFDDPLNTPPKLEIINVEMRNFYLVEKSNQFIDSIFLIPQSFVYLELNNMEISNFFLEYPLMIFERYFQSEVGSYIKIKGSIIKNFNSEIFKADISKNLQNLFEISQFLGNIYFINITFQNMNLRDSQIYLIKISNNRQNISINSISFINLTSLRLIFVDSCLLEINYLFIKNCSFGETSLITQNGSEIYIHNIKINSNVWSGIADFIESYYSKIIFNQSFFFDNDNMSLSFYNSQIEIHNSIFQRLKILKTNMFLLTLTAFSTQNCSWSFIFSRTLFFCQNIEKIYFESNNFSNISTETFLYGSSVHSLLMVNLNFQKIRNIISFIGAGSSILYNSFLNSNFSDLNIKITFCMISIGNLLIKNTQFNSIFFNDSKSNILIQIQSGYYLILDSRFEKIQFIDGGNQIISLKIGSANITNCIFKNNGWLHYVNILTKIAREFIDLFYIWTCNDVYFSNNTFINEGSISLFSGFIIATLHKGNFLIENCSFIARNKSKGLNYHGVILIDIPKVYILNNYFEGLECCDYNSIGHSNGVLSLQGESSYLRKGNEKTAFLRNNTFIDCFCENAGSFGVMNFLNVTIQKIMIKNSMSSIKAGSFEIISCPYVIVEEIKIYNSSSSIGGLAYLYNIKILAINKLVAQTILSKSGGIFARYIGNIEFNNLFLNESFSKDSGGVLLIFSGNIFMKNIYINKIVSSGEGGSFYLQDRANFFVQNLFCDVSIANKGGFLFDSSAIAVEINDSSILSCDTVNSGGAIFFDNIFRLQLDNVIFINNSCQGNGIIFLNSWEIDSKFNFFDIIFRNNIAKIGSNIYSESEAMFSLVNITSEKNIKTAFVFICYSMTIVEITNIRILDSYSQNYFFVFQDIALFLNNLTLNFNFGQGALISLIYCKNSEIKNVKNILTEDSISAIIFEIEASNISFDNIKLILKNNSTVSLITSKNSEIKLNDSSFENSFSNEAFLKASFSEIYLFNCLFKNITGPVLHLSNSNFFIISSFFYENIPNNISQIQNIFVEAKYIRETGIGLIDNSYFQGNSGTSIQILDFGKISIRNSIFKGKSNGNCVIINEILFIDIFSSNFSNFNAYKGAALYIISEEHDETEYNIVINSSNFINNTADFGGAVYLEGEINSLTHNCMFSWNSARLVGGSIKIFTFSEDINEISNSVFLNNFAEFGYPNVFSNTYLIANNNTFFNNSGKKIFCDCEIFSFPLKFNLTSSVLLQNNKIIFTSGEQFDLLFNLLGNDKFIFFSDKPLTSNLFYSESNISLQISIQNGLSQPTTTGVIYFKNLLIKAKPDSFFSLNLSVKVSDFEHIETTNTYFQSFEFYSRPCLIGEIYSNMETCLLCPRKTYSFVDPMLFKNRKSFCKKCNPKAFCPGGKYLIPNEGYWRSNENSSILNLCLNAKFCLGGPKTSNLDELANFSIEILTHGICAQGHTGNLCFDCIKGYGKIELGGLCEKCENTAAWNIIRLILLMLFIIFYIFFNARPIIIENSKFYNTMLKIIINHLQKLSLISMSNMKKIMERMRDFFSFFNGLSILSENSFSNECYMESLLQNDKEEFYLYKVLVVIILPFIFTIFSFLSYAIINYNSKSLFTKKFSAIFFTAIFLFYPLIVKCSLSLFNCFYLDESKTEYLFASPSVKCWQENHFIFSVFVGGFGILFWGIGFLCFLIFYLRKKNQENNQGFAIGASKENKVVIKLFKVECGGSENLGYSFFIKDYENKYYYWETIIFAKKFALIGIQSVPNVIGEEIQDFLFLLLLFIYLFCIIDKKPFKFHKMNNLEAFSMISIIGCKVFMIIGNSYSQISYVPPIILIVLILFNFLFFLMATIYFCKMTEWMKLKKELCRKLKIIQDKFKNQKKKVIPAKFNEILKKLDL